MPSQGADPRRYWDACAFIAFFKGEPGRVDDCRRLLDEAASGQFKVFTSALSLVEVTRSRGETVDPTRRSMIERFFENDYVSIVNADRYTIEQARNLIWAHTTLRPTDAVHLASALRARCTIFYTYDETLIALDQKIAALQIKAPKWEGQLTLPDGGASVGDE